MSIMEVDDNILGKSWFTDEMLDRKYGLVDYFLEAIG
jgi:hypothetical protein